MTQRYYLYDTQIIVPTKNPLKSRELLNLEGLDVIGKIPTKDGVSLFYRDENGYIVYGNFVLKADENYEGVATPISETISFAADTPIFLKNGFYDPDGSYYFFYNANNNIYLRTFLVRQGIFGDEILVQENAKFLKMERIKENFFIIFKDIAHKEIYDRIDELDEGEIKLLFLFENDISTFEGKFDQLLKKQILDIPFNDIGIEKWSCENKVNNNKGFLYFNGDTELVENAFSINGYCFQTTSACFMEMDKEADEYTLTIRGSWLSSDADKIETTNLIVRTIGDTIQVTYPDGSIESKAFEFLGFSTAGEEFVNSTITSSLIDGKRLYQLCFSTSYNDQEVIFQKAIVQEDLEDYENDSYVKINNQLLYDYISLQNFAHTKSAIKDIHSAFERNLIEGGHQNSVILTGDFLNNFIQQSIDRRRRTTYLTIPSDVVLVEEEYTTIKYDDHEKAFWLCPGASLEIGGTEKITVYMESNSTLVNNGASKARIFAKSSCSVNIGDGEDFEVFFEDGVILSNPNESTFLKKEEHIVFDYSLLSEQGCREVEDAPTVKTLEFPFFPSNEVISSLTATCISEADGENRFVDNGDGTISDLTQGLMWLKSPVDVPQDKTNKQNQAYNFAKDAEYSNYSDWRLPTGGEMSTLDGVIDIGTTCITGEVCTTETVAASSVLPPTSAGPISGTVDIETCVIDECISGIPYVLVEDGPFDFATYVDGYNNNVTTWTIDSDGDSETGAGDFYAYDLSDHTSTLVGATDGEEKVLGLLVRPIDTKLKVLYDDGTQLELPTVEGETVTLEKEGLVKLVRSGIGALYDNYNVLVEYTEVTEEVKNMSYPGHYKLNSSSRYFFGSYLPVNRTSQNNDLRDTVLPLFVEEDTQIPNSIFTDPENNIRVCENIRQRYDLTPFIIEYDSNVLGITLWTPFTRVNNQVGVQYSLKEEFLMKPTYSSYDTLSSQTYPLNSYFCAYHFDKLLNIRKLLVKDIIFEVAGEIILGGITEQNTYLREIKAINFFDSPQKYKTAEFDVLIDTKDLADRESYINNYEEIRNFVKTIVENWKPATANINRIIEDKTLIMAELLKDEYTQVLVGVTARQNSNAYYVRSVDTGNLSVLSSSTKFDDAVDWIGVGRINTPYIKTGVTRIRQSAKKIKIPFETRYDTDVYRTFVFSPKNAKYYVTNKDRDGFIVESSFLVEEEVAWITLNTKQAVNGTIKWRRAIPEGELIANNIDRIDEVNEQSNRYVVKLAEFGFPQFPNTNYSVILSSDQNVNLWVESKTPSEFIIRRSYAGTDTEIDFMVVEGNSKWWKDITA
jgi:hypothetical protein